MFLPVGDEPNPRGVAWVNWSIIVANVAVYVLITLPLSFQSADTTDPAFMEYLRMLSAIYGDALDLRQVASSVSAYDLYVLEHGFRPAAPQLGDLFTCMFLHSGFMHLLGNMLFLWIYGDNVEARLGHGGYLGGYLLAGVAGTVFHAVVSAGSPMPMVGASGAISGVAGYYFLLFPGNVVRVLVVLFPFFMRVVRINARWFLGLYFLVWENLLPFFLGSGGSVAYGAHIGGFMAGLFMAWRSRSEEHGSSRDALELAGRLHHPDDDTSDALASRVSRHVDAGRVEDAAEVVLESWSRPEARDIAAADLVVVGEWLNAHGHARQALAVFERARKQATRRADAARAHLGMALVYLQQQNSPGQAYAHLKDALRLDPDPETAAEARALLDDIVARQGMRLSRWDR